MTSSVKPVVRCAIYTRKSTDEGLDKEFTSLDAQRESGEAYVASLRHEGWTFLADRYDDGGYSGGDMERPALKRLLADIDAGRVDCVVVYKVDRFSRSLLDFAKMMERFQKHNVSFVSVTQQFNTASSMGRLVLNVLLSFAQYEREIISERTRDKIAAARRKGKWSGGAPILGYDVNDRTKLIVNELEAAQVREIFNLYLEHESLLPVVRELVRRGWRTKRWTTKKGNERGGYEFNKNRLYQLLNNVTYAGKIRYKQELHAGEHTAIVSDETFERVQAILRRNRLTGSSLVRNRYGALLKGILRCGPCNRAMIHSFTSKKKKRYRYYVCATASKSGWDKCPTCSVPAGEVERFIVDQIRVIGRDPGLIRETFTQAQDQVEVGIRQLALESETAARELQRQNAELRRLSGSAKADPGRLAEIHERIQSAERRASEIRNKLVLLERERVDEHDVAKALAHFDGVWESLSPHQQARLLRLLLERVDYDGEKGSVVLRFHATGIRSLTESMNGRTHVTAND